MTQEEASSSRAFFVLLAVAFVSLSVFFVTADIRRVLAVIPDDAAYYFKIAENAAEGRGLTFDGIGRTNGFQPLWLSILVPVHAIFHGAPEVMCRMFLILQLVFLCGAAVMMNAIQSRFFSRNAALMSGLLFLFFVFVPAANGMESAVLVFSLALLFFFAWRAKIFGRQDAIREFVFGVLLGLVVLARLDMIFLAGVVLAFCLGRILIDRGPGRVTAFVAVLVGVVAVVSPYLVYNRLSFGSVFPISAALKSSFPKVIVTGCSFSSLGKTRSLGIGIALGYLAWFIMRFAELKRNLRGRMFFQTGLAMMACAVVMHFLHTLFFMKWAVFAWHFIPYALFGTAAICEPVDRMAPAAGGARRGLLYWAALAAIAVFGGFTVARNFNQSLDRNWRPVAYDASLWARRNTDVNVVFAMKDAGNFGYFSERPVINLDGVVNNLEYQEVLRDKHLKEYLRSRGVRFIAQHAFWDRSDILSGDYDSYSMSYPSHKYESSSDEIVLARADEVFRSRQYFDGPYRTAFIIWRLRYE